jgi:hypothetical protein
MGAKAFATVAAAICIAAATASGSSATTPACQSMSPQTAAAMTAMNTIFGRKWEVGGLCCHGDSCSWVGSKSVKTSLPGATSGAIVVLPVGSKLVCSPACVASTKPTGKGWVIHAGGMTCTVVFGRKPSCTAG